MAGHSKFSNIKHRKEKADAKKGKVFTKIGREIAVAVKLGGADPSANITLKNIIAKAKASNMPNDTIERSIKKASGDSGAAAYEKVVYEGYGPGGVAVMAEALTDNKNRTAANVRNAFTKGGGNVGSMGCVEYLFSKQGVILIDIGATSLSADELMEIIIDAGAEDLITSEEGYEILTGADEGVFAAVSDALTARGVVPVSAEMTLIPATYVNLTEAEDIKKMNKLLDLLTDEDDVTNIYHNWENENG